MQFNEWRQRAPGHYRTCVDNLLPTLTSRSVRSDWCELRDHTPLLQLTPEVGRMWFPIVMSGDCPGAIATAEIAHLALPARHLEATSGNRVRTWLAAWLSVRLGVNHTVVTQRLAKIALKWHIGRETADPEAAASTAPSLDGPSADLACAVALLSHLTQTRPTDAWIVSGALTGPAGQIQPIGLTAEKRAIIATELPDLPPERCVIVTGPAPLDFEQLLCDVLGFDIISRLLDAFEMSVTAYIDTAVAFWRARDEAGADSSAEHALALNPSPTETETALLIRAANAIHRGDLDLVDTLFAQLDRLPAHAHDPWVRLEWRCRRAVAQLDWLDLAAARTTIDALLVELAVWRDTAGFALFRPQWESLQLQALGTSSRIHVAEGNLPLAIAERERAFELGPPQEHARNALELAELVFRQGDTDRARNLLTHAGANLHHLQMGPPRERVARFLDLSTRRWGIAPPTAAEINAAAATAPVLKQWPQPGELVATLLASNESTALVWFEVHAFNPAAPLEIHPAYRWMLVTSCARAVQQGWSNPRWREGVAHIIAKLQPLARVDRTLLRIADDFVAGASPAALLSRAFY